MPAGRPSNYNPEIAAAVCAQIAIGDLLTKVCTKPGMPSIATVFNWFGRHPEFVEQYARAKESQCEVLGNQLVELAATARLGEKRKTMPDGKVEIVTGDMVERSKLHVDALKWYLSKVMPKKYGDRAAIEHSGPGGAELKITVTRADK